MARKNILTESMEMDNKQSFTDKIYNTIAVTLSILCVATCIVCLISFFTSQNIGINIWLFSFYPLIIMFIAGIFIATKETLRNRYFSSVLALTINIIGVALFITIIIVQLAVLKKVCVLPGTMPIL